MEKYKELRDFAERIKAKGIPEQQYIAEGILGLLSEVKTDRGETPHPPQAVPLPLKGEGFKREDLKGCIVEEANGDRWVVEGWVYEAKAMQDSLNRELRLAHVRRTFSREELEAGLFKVVGKRKED